MLISEAWNVYESDKILEGYSPQTLSQYKIQCNLLIRFFGDIDISTITYEQIKQYLIKDVNRLKPSSINHRKKFIKSLFGHLHNEEYIDKNVSLKLKETKEGQRIPKALNEEEIETLRDACKTVFERTLIELLFATGCRAGEIYGLNKDNVNWDKRTMTVIGKGDKQREVYFTTRCSIWLKKYLKQRKDDDPALFVTERAPHRISISQMRWIMKRIASRTDINKSIYLHLWRHSMATYLLNKDCPIEAIKEFLGHMKISSTQIYCQLSGEHRRRIYERYM